MSQHERQQTKVDHHHGLLSLITSSTINPGSISSAFEYLVNLSLRADRIHPRLVAQPDQVELALLPLFHLAAR